MYILMFSSEIYIYIYDVRPMLISLNSQWMTTFHKHPFDTQAELRIISKTK